PLMWLLYILVVRELYSLIFEGYQGIYTVTRWSMYAAWTLSICLAIVSSTLTWRSNAGISTRVYYFQIERGIVFGLVLFIPVALFFLSRYPIQLHRNIIVHCFLYSVLFLTDAAALLLDALSPTGISHFANLLLVAFSGCCYLAWALLLTRKGEERNVVVHHRANPAEEDRLLQQLSAMNHTLLQVIRK
ncbi:MAG: hypothetical protein M3Z23_11370, partial [Acidobacteriota bacterium]|nr:hypothetical protein [Acidobacteriota bacterium]